MSNEALKRTERENLISDDARPHHEKPKEQTPDILPSQHLWTSSQQEHVV